MLSSSHRNGDKIDEAVHYFSKFINSRPKRTSTADLQVQLVIIEEESVAHGLDAEHLSVLVDAAACGNLAQKWSIRLIKALIPKTTVPDSAVMKAISWMCTNKPPIIVQSFLIRWILIVYDYIEDLKHLHNVYGILFYFLENQVLMPHMCHLLYLLTRKDDVRMFRVSKLIQLQKQMGTQPYLTGLLSIYQVYYPNLVTLPARSTNVIFFKSYDRIWSSVVRKVKEQSVQTAELETSRRKPADVSHKPPASKRRRREVIPPVSVSSSGEGDRSQAVEKISLSFDVAQVPLVHIGSFMEMVDKIDRIEIPSQISAALRDPLLQHIVAYSGDKAIASRFSYWIQHTLVEELLNCSGYNAEAEKLLQHLILFTDFLQEGIPVVDNFLHMYLHRWNGSDYRPYILQLIGRSRMQPGTVLKEMVLEPLRKLFFTSSVYFKCQVILTLTDLTENYASLELFRYKNSLSQHESESISSQSSGNNVSTYLSLFQETTEKFDPIETLQELVQFVISIANVGLIAENDNTLFMYHVIGYIELLSTLNQRFEIPYLFLPSKFLISRIIFSNSAYSCNKLCSILCSYKKSFMALRSVSQQSGEACIGLSKVPEFNSIVIDVCNSFSRCRLQSTKLELGTSMQELVTSVRDLTVPRIDGALSIYEHQAFASFVYNFWKKSQPPDSRYQPSKINRSKFLKQAYFDYLEQQGLSGVIQYLKMFLRNLHSSDH